MKRRISLDIEVNDKDHEYCGYDKPYRCEFLASDCTIFGFLKGSWANPHRHEDCLMKEVVE